jgi:hypothetical protein
MSDSAQPQNAANHARFVPGYHYLALTLALINLIWAIMRSVRHPTIESHAAILVGVILILALWYARIFPLAVQDRLIRLEERLRMQRVLSPAIMSRFDEFLPAQLIALRFASDAELPELASKVLNERITDRKQIKLLIRDWRADHMRV